MYHGISDNVDSSRSPYYRTVTTPSVFASHVHYLKQHGYQVVALSQAVARLGSLSQASQANDRAVVITFDDGLRNFYTSAYPILSGAGMVATVFLVSGCLNGTFLGGEECLRIAEIKELSRQGIEFGSHSETHSHLYDLAPCEVERELTASKATIQETLGKEVTLFSYPFRFPEHEAKFTHFFRRALVEAGYQAGVTTVIGRAGPDDDVLFLPRIPINACDDQVLFSAKLEGAYDWLHLPQLILKKSRAMMRRASAQRKQ
jgi:peptidoglycan/xylan/chitin deacetylase (PgdA/CDA1 family)